LFVSRVAKWGYSPFEADVAHATLPCPEEVETLQRHLQAEPGGNRLQGVATTA
jgi:hypothetical protein